MTTSAKRPPRLLMLVHGYFPADPRVASETRAAVAAGFEVDIIALREAGDEAQIERRSVHCFRLPVEHRRGVGFVSSLLEYLEFTARATVRAARLTRRRKYDVVQVHNPPDFLVLAALIPRLSGAPIVLDVHDLASDMFMMRFGKRPGARLADRALRALERTAGRLATAVITVHEPYRRELAARGVAVDKISVVMNSVDETILPPPSQAANGHLSGFRAVYHGTVTPHYGVGLIVDAAGALRDRVQDLRIEIYGVGDAIPELRERARALELEETLHIGDRYLPRAEVLRAVRGASVGIIPNLPTPLNRFALSTKLLEYVAMGIPVVSADLPTIREHFSADEVRFFRAGDADSLADALEAVAADPEAAASRAAAARRRYEAYSWAHSERTYIEVLRQAMRRSRRRNSDVVQVT